jgi:hypothetical protein
MFGVEDDAAKQRPGEPPPPASRWFGGADDSLECGDTPRWPELTGLGAIDPSSGGRVG